jgi:caspase domain-containing protein
MYARIHLWACLVGCWLLFSLASPQVRAQAAGSPPGKQWAILIGIEKYERANPLRFTVNDVVQIGQTLRVRGGVDPANILQITDDSDYHPTKVGIMQALSDWLRKPGPQDDLIVYFSGHGFRDADGKAYLAPIDVDPADPAASGIPLEWMREQIAGCHAHFKLLVLDACHAGSEKGEQKSLGLAAEEMGQAFRNLEGVVTLASSTAAQKSQIWEDKEQSLFSYWLNQGLKGHADADSDGNVDIDELYKFVSRSVRRTAELRFPLKQDPVRIVRTGTLDVPVVLHLVPQRLKQMLDDMAEQLSESILEQKFAKVGVLEFTNDTKLGELLGADFGLLGKYCADELEKDLVDYGNGKYSLVDKNRLRAALEAQGFALKDLGSTERLQQLSHDAGFVPVIALGTLRNRAGRIVNVQCKLIQTNSDDLAGLVGGTAALNESEWAMLGRSVALRPEDRRPAAPTIDAAPKPADDALIGRLDEKAAGAHPLADPTFPYRVKLVIKGQERKGVFRGNDYFVPVRKGEVYEIWLENNSGNTVLLRLLVDGLNTLPEPEGTKGVTTMIVGKRVNLDEARAWELDPNYARVTAVRGFVTEVSVQGKLKEFTVVDAEQSLAARQKFTSQLGIITAAFYAPKSGSRGALGTAAGEERNEKIERGHHLVPGNLISVVHIRYVDADSPELAGR